MSKYHEISISDPNTGHVEIYNTIREARDEARKMPYSPVYINLYDEYGIIDDIAIVNKTPAAQALRAIKSEKRSQASRENGKKGGRPRKLKANPKKS